MPIDVSTISVPQSIRNVLLDMRGHLVFDRFDQKGANGYTFFAFNTMMQRNVVVKFYYWGGERDTFPEPERLAQLTFRTILPVYHAAPVDSDYAYFITKFCENGDVDNFLEKKPMPLRGAVDATIDVLSGVSFLHSNGYVHRDLKPSNIFVDSDERFLIGDFGSVKRFTDEWASSFSTHSRLYRPPETFQGPRYHRTGDIYQVGMLMYQLLGGYLPYDETAWLNSKQLIEYHKLDKSDRQIYANNILEERIMRSKIIDLNSLPPWVPTQLKTILRTATKYSIEDRYPSCVEMLARLNKCRPSLRQWEVVDGVPVLRGKTEFRIVETGTSYSVEKKRTGAWKTITEARNLTLTDAVTYAQGE
jgi:serine/threonine protein kinase